MAAGKPVIGVREGGLLETVVHGETGFLIPANPSEEDLIEAVQKMGPETAREMRDACEALARQFDKKIFVEKPLKTLAIILGLTTTFATAFFFISHALMFGTGFDILFQKFLGNIFGI